MIPVALHVIHIRKATLTGGLKRASGTVQCSVWDHYSSGKNQGKLRANQPQLTAAPDYERKRKFRVPRFVLDYQADIALDAWLDIGRYAREVFAA